MEDELIFAYYHIAGYALDTPWMRDDQTGAGTDDYAGPDDNQGQYPNPEGYDNA